MACLLDAAWAVGITFHRRGENRFELTGAAKADESTRALQSFCSGRGAPQQPQSMFLFILDEVNVPQAEHRCRAPEDGRDEPFFHVAIVAEAEHRPQARSEVVVVRLEGTAVDLPIRLLRQVAVVRVRIQLLQYGLSCDYTAKKSNYFF